MAVKRLLTEFGMGASLRRQDYTQAAVRGVKDALWHNSIIMDPCIAQIGLAHR